MTGRLVAAVLSLGQLGARTASDAAPKAVSNGTVEDGAVIAAPQGAPVLVVRGDGLRTNTADGVAFDLAALNALPTVEAGLHSGVRNVDGPKAAEKTATGIIAALQEPFSVGERQVFISSSIGIALGTSGGATPRELMRDADTAMYHAKWNGKARYELFNPQHQRAVEQLRLETDLRDAEEPQEMALGYQPIVALGTQEIIVTITCTSPTKSLPLW